MPHFKNKKNIITKKYWDFFGFKLPHLKQDLMTDI